MLLAEVRVISGTAAEMIVYEYERDHDYDANHLLPTPCQPPQPRDGPPTGLVGDFLRLGRVREKPESICRT